jgi:hypothetical protein
VTPGRKKTAANERIARILYLRLDWLVVAAGLEPATNQAFQEVQEELRTELPQKGQRESVAT